MYKYAANLYNINMKGFIEKNVFKKTVVTKNNTFKLFLLGDVEKKKHVLNNKRQCFFNGCITRYGSHTLFI